jgi:hypothetical protein
LHRISENECNADLGCPACKGEGRVLHEESPARECRKCQGDGRTTGPRKARLRADAEEIAAHYGLRCYFQTDPRGCPLYLIDPASIPSDLTRYQGESYYGLGDGPARDRWIDSNYTQGHAVTRLGR